MNLHQKYILPTQTRYFRIYELSDSHFNGVSTRFLHDRDIRRDGPAIRGGRLRDHELQAGAGEAARVDAAEGAGFVLQKPDWLERD